MKGQARRTSDWHVLDAVDDVMAVQEDALGKASRTQVLETIVESGAAEVTPVRPWTNYQAITKIPRWDQVPDGEG